MQFKIRWIPIRLKNTFNCKTKILQRKRLQKGKILWRSTGVERILCRSLRIFLFHGFKSNSNWQKDTVWIVTFTTTTLITIFEMFMYPNHTFPLFVPVNYFAFVLNLNLTWLFLFNIIFSKHTHFISLSLFLCLDWLYLWWFRSVHEKFLKLTLNDSPPIMNVICRGDWADVNASSLALSMLPVGRESHQICAV